LGVQRASIAA